MFNISTYLRKHLFNLTSSSGTLYVLPPSAPHRFFSSQLNVPKRTQYLLPTLSEIWLLLTPLPKTSLVSIIPLNCQIPGLQTWLVLLLFWKHFPALACNSTIFPTQSWCFLGPIAFFSLYVFHKQTKKHIIPTVHFTMAFMCNSLIYLSLFLSLSLIMLLSSAPYFQRHTRHLHVYTPQAFQKQ